MPLPNKNAPTLKDVAQRAGVSKVAASLVLNGSRTNAGVSEATRGRILAAAAELRYHPNTVARSLSRRRTDIIGLYLGYGYIDARNAFFAEIISGLQKGCNEHRKDLLVHGTFRGQSVEDIYAEMIGGKIDGLVLIAPPGDPLADRLVASRLPVVAMADPLPLLPSVAADDAQGSRLLAEHLASKGHHHVLYRMSPRRHTSVERRLAAFTATAAARGMTVTQSRAADHSGRLGAEESARLTLPAGERPTAVACSNDFLAFHLLDSCRSLGLRVPDDLAVAGFDGVMSPLGPALRLTTIRAPWVAVARTAVSLLVSQIDGREIPAETVLPVELVVGDTT